MIDSTKRNGKRVLVVVGLLALVLALPAGVSAHPDHPSGETALPAAPPTETADEGGSGGTSPALVGGVVVVLLAGLGGLIYAREKQRRGTGEAAGSVVAEPAHAAQRREAKRRARSSW